MIRELKTISDTELKSLLNTEIAIFEKIDAPYFSIEMHNGTPVFLKSNHEEISDIDILINSMYRDIKIMSNDIIKQIHQNDYKIGLWYFPIEKPRSITYKNYANRFMISDFSQNISDEIISLKSLGILPQPIIAKTTITDKLLSKIKSYSDGNITSLFLLYELTKSVSKYSGTPMQEMEGVVFKTKKHPYQIIINNPEIIDKNAPSKRIYRDVILKDFLFWYNKHLPYIEGDSILKKITFLFNKYLNETDITDRYNIVSDNLTPPAYGYIGKLSLDLIPNQELQQRLVTDRVSREMYKIILNACRKPMKKTSNELLAESEITSFNKMIKEIKEAD